MTSRTSIEYSETIFAQLRTFHESHKMPNILFSGPCSNTKNALIRDFITLIHGEDSTTRREYVMHVNCAHGKGIKFFRNDLKFFIKSNIDSQNGVVFKSVVLANADKLTSDAQSALRRCIEVYNHNTRFFITIEDKHQLLKPILSRFCEIYVPPSPQHRRYTPPVQTAEHTRELLRRAIDTTSRIGALKRTIFTFVRHHSPVTCADIAQLAQMLVDKGYSGLLLTQLVSRGGMSAYLSDEDKYELIVFIENIQPEIRSEWMLIMHILYYTFIRSPHNIIDECMRHV